MAFGKHPPIPRSARRIVWLSRAISAVALVIGLSVGSQWAAEGETAVALLFLAMSVAYVLATWISPMSPMLWIAIGGLVLVLFLLDPGVVTLALAGASALTFVLLTSRRRGQIDSASLRPVFDDTVMRGAEAYVAELTELGWRHVGGYAFESGKTIVTASVLLHPDLDRYAEITDMVFGIESRFDGDRFLVTNNTGRARFPANYLANSRYGASPAELAEAHQLALDIIADHGRTPVALDEEAIVEEALATEVETTEWNGDHRALLGFGKGAGPVDGSPEAATRIEAWLAGEPIDQTAE